MPLSAGREITVFSTVGFHPPEHPPRFRQSVRTGPVIDYVWNGSAARTSLPEVSARGSHVIESIWTTLSARTLAKSRSDPQRLAGSRRLKSRRPIFLGLRARPGKTERPLYFSNPSR